jgi:hypothetical protein
MHRIAGNASYWSRSRIAVVGSWSSIRLHLVHGKRSAALRVPSRFVHLATVTTAVSSDHTALSAPFCLCLSLIRVPSHRNNAFAEGKCDVFAIEAAVDRSLRPIAPPSSARTTNIATTFSTNARLAYGPPQYQIRHQTIIKPTNSQK